MLSRKSFYAKSERKQNPVHVYSELKCHKILLLFKKIYIYCLTNMKIHCHKRCCDEKNIVITSKDFEIFQIYDFLHYYPKQNISFHIY